MGWQRLRRSIGDAPVRTLINRGEYAVEGLRNAHVQAVLFEGPARSTQKAKRRSVAGQSPARSAARTT